MNKIVQYLLIISAVIFLSDTFQKIHFAPDDTYIYMQYARNIASGNGFSFNPGEPSFGVTSPLWVYFLTVPYYLKIDSFWFAKLIDMIFLILSVFVFFKLSDIFFGNNITVRILAVSVFILNAWLIRWSFTGMETSFAVFLVLAAFYLYFKGKYYLLFFILAALQLTRPETFVLAIIFFLFVLINKIKSRKFRISELLFWILSYAVLIVPFYLYAKFNFGTVLPNTVLGKSTLTLSGGIVINQLTQIGKTLAASGIIEIILTVIYITIFLRKDKNEKTYIMLLWIAGLIILYVITDADIISRYLLIISPFFILTGFNLFSRFKNFKNSFAVIAFMVFLCYSQIIFYVFIRPSTDNFTRGVETCLIPVGNWLKDNTSPGSRILVNDVGAIGYFSERYIIDAAALINSDLDLNRRIMSTPLEKRMTTHKLLDIVNADYVIDRSTGSETGNTEFQNIKLTFLFMREFPGLGIKNESSRYYKVYKVEHD